MTLSPPPLLAGLLRTTLYVRGSRPVHGMGMDAPGALPSELGA
eukprot:CAMPEP_0119112952 /NCGR_PEP_ID=MMETSP1180-20130426/42307_1 /TAXON_ID=3052 ORGANISM="Chlamydomonas cf sp, Strain CCMP681" /NCGR_SAMPLE_ID=MMETSP1180 /ASSEMBLY_ACC=CAM_ASM_000741 /LENGTH=42 /DNA_ID= /DNA_START= /DNA_END= /DNA_ORIENTATION=